MKTLEEFDPRPEKYRGTAKENLKPLLESVHDQGLCISLLLDPKTRCWNEGVTSLPSTSTPQLPSISSLQRAVTEFLKSLEVSEDEARLIERKTVGQRDSPYWFFMRKYRITASMFGEVLDSWCLQSTPFLVPHQMEQCMIHHHLISHMPF